MRSFLLACLSIVIIGTAAHFATDRFDPPVTNASSNPAVRLD
ncbi:hypothetical protein R3X27_19630 [Tropicimonas sp. TH_r6]|nr:hypothetical protein [Tropicimonas sp. TH_r6]MDV7144897.1 hypothetical protein [Tropicimonas sp. TH_r6]